MRSIIRYLITATACVIVGLTVKYSLPVSFHFAFDIAMRDKPPFTWPTPMSLQCYDTGHWIIEQYNPGNTQGRKI